MKTFVMVFLSLFLAKGCNKQLREEMKSTSIEYSAVSRGFYYNIQIQDDELSVIRNRNEKPKTYKLARQDWNELAKLYQKVKLEELEHYVDPTQKRFYDGAAIASLQITVDGNTYQTRSFDHGTPPVEIEEFVNKITSLINFEQNDN
jgi:hypothetical protein